MPIPARTTVRPLLPGSQITPNCGAKFRLGCRTRSPDRGTPPNWLIRLALPVQGAWVPKEAATAEHGIVGKSESLRPVSRTYCTPMVTVRLERSFQVSPAYACRRVSLKPPQGEPSADFSLKQLRPFPSVMLSTG